MAKNGQVQKIRDLWFTPSHKNRQLAIQLMEGQKVNRTDVFYGAHLTDAQLDFLAHFATDKNGHRQLYYGGAYRSTGKTTLLCVAAHIHAMHYPESTVVLFSYNRDTQWEMLSNYEQHARNSEFKRYLKNRERHETALYNNGSRIVFDVLPTAHHMRGGKIEQYKKVDWFGFDNVSDMAELGYSDFFTRTKKPIIATANDVWVSGFQQKFGMEYREPSKPKPIPETEEPEKEKPPSAT